MNNNRTPRTNRNRSANQPQGNNQEQLTEHQKLAKFAARLLLISSITINTTKEDRFLVAASTLSLIAGFLLIRSAEVESREEQVAPGQTTFANNLKMIGTKGALLFSFILFTALITEVILKQPPTIAGQTPVAGTAGALFVR